MKKIEKTSDAFDLESVASLICECLNTFSKNINDLYELDIIKVILVCFKFCITVISSATLDQTWQVTVSNLATLNKSKLLKKLTYECSGVVKNLFNNG